MMEIIDYIVLKNIKGTYYLYKEVIRFQGGFQPSRWFLVFEGTESECYKKKARLDAELVEIV